jgi:hypothetical protein
MVGRFVEEQDVGFRGERAGKRGAAGFAAGETLRRAVGVEAEFAEQIVGAERIVERSELGAGIGADRRRSRKDPDPAAGNGWSRSFGDHLAAGRFGQAGGDAQQRRLCPSRCGRPARCGRRHGRKRKRLSEKSGLPPKVSERFSARRSGGEMAMEVSCRTGAFSDGWQGKKQEPRRVRSDAPRLFDCVRPVLRAGCDIFAAIGTPVAAAAVGRLAEQVAGGAADGCAGERAADLCAGRCRPTAPPTAAPPTAVCSAVVQPANAPITARAAMVFVSFMGRSPFIPPVQ